MVVLITLHDASFRVTCGINCCPRRYSKFHSFKRHIYRAHKDILTQRNLSISQSSSEELQECSINDHDCESSVNDGDDHSTGLDVELVDTATVAALNAPTSTTVFKVKAAALFLLKAQEILKISHTSLIGLIEDIDEFFQFNLDALEAKVLEYICSLSHIGETTRNEIKDSLKEVFIQHQDTLFSGLKTRYHQERYYKEHLGLLVSLFIFVLHYNTL